MKRIASLTLRGPGRRFWGSPRGETADPPECNAAPTIVPPDAPISFTATATDICGNVTPEINGYDCHFVNPAGKVVDKTESCVVTFSGDTITISDSGGVGDLITWTIETIDASGNPAEIECEVEVVNPGKGKGKGKK